MLEFINQVIGSVQVWRFQWRLHFLNCLAGLVGSSRTFLDVIFSRQPEWSCDVGARECERLRNETYFVPCQGQSVLPGVRFKMGEESNNFLLYFKLVCKDSHLDWNLPLASSAFFMGSLIGGALFGILSDSKGRKLTAVWALCLALLASLLVVTPGPIQLYVVARFLDGLSFGGYAISTYLISVEYSRPDRRYLGVASYLALWGPAMLLTTGTHQLLAHHPWQLGAFVSSLPTLLLLLLTLWLGVESVCWTLSLPTLASSRLRVKTLLESIAKVIQMDVASTPSCRFNRGMSTQSVHDIFKGHRYKPYRRSILVLFYVWFITSVTYYLRYYEAFFKQSPRELHTSTNNLILLSSACNLLGFLATPIAARFLARRTILLSTILLSAACSLSLIIENKYSSFILMLLGKTAGSAQFSIVYLVTPELVSTPLRGLLFGLCFGMSRVGAMVAPHVLNVADLFEPLPHVVVGTGLLIAFMAVWGLVPETRNIDLLHDYYQIKEFYQKRSRGDQNFPASGSLTKSFESTI